MHSNRFAPIADASAKLVSEEKLRISFEYLDWESEEFFFHGLEPTYYQKVFECFTEIKKSKEADITQQTHQSLKPKSIFNGNTSIKSSFPEPVIEKIKNKLFIQTRDDQSSMQQALEITSRAFEICIAKNYGRFHGFIWLNTFFIVWFDPAHNLYPMNNRIKKNIDVATVKCFSTDTVCQLRETIKALQEENAELYEAFANK